MKLKYRAYILIPTGGRAEQAAETARKWKETRLFKVIAYAWDDETAKALKPYCHKIFRGHRKPFSQLQNFMAAQIKKWDVIICGADDLWPKYGINLIKQAAVEVDGCIIWVRDGLFDEQPTHPIITRGWYNKQPRGEIFDPWFKHNFCDTDLFVRASMENEVVKCFDISFEHRHHLKGGRKKDRIDDAGMYFWQNDKEYFRMKQGRFLETYGSDIPQIRTLELNEVA